MFAGKKAKVPTGATIGDGTEDERGGLTPPAESAPGLRRGRKWGVSTRRWKIAQIKGIELVDISPTPQRIHGIWMVRPGTWVTLSPVL